MWLRMMGAAPHWSKRGKEIHDSQAEPSLSALLEEAKKARRINDKNRRSINQLLAPASPAAATAQRPYFGSRSRALSWSPAVVREDEVWAWLAPAYSSSACVSAPLANSQMPLSFLVPKPSHFTDLRRLLRLFAMLQSLNTTHCQGRKSVLGVLSSDSSSNRKLSRLMSSHV